MGSTGLKLLLEAVDLSLHHVLDATPLFLPGVDVLVLDDTNSVLSENIGAIGRDSAEGDLDFISLQVRVTLDLQVLTAGWGRILRNESLGHLHGADIQTWSSHTRT